MLAESVQDGFVGGQKLKPVFDFEKKLAFSQGVQQETDIETLQKLIDGCDSIIKTSTEIDKSGIDYIATLRRGATIRIDAKTREKGCSEFWRYEEPEFAPEIWSVMPYGKFNIPPEQAKVGWTLDEKKEVDYIFCTFDPVDSNKVYLLPFQLYRMAFRKNYPCWKEDYQISIQESKKNGRSWQSQCVFVPASIILNAIYIEMEAYKKLLDQQELDFGGQS